MLTRNVLAVACAVCLAAGCSSGGDGAADPGPFGADGGPVRVDPDARGDAGGSEDGPSPAPPIPNGPPVHQSGTRLKARWAVTQDGYRSFDGWYDVQRKEACHLLTAADGKMRCLTERAEYTTSAYADASCTVELVEMLPATCTPKPAVMSYDFNGTGTHIYALGPRHSNTIYGGYLNASCVKQTISGPAYYSVGSEIPASSYVEMTRTTSTTPGRIAERYWAGSDGSHHFIGWTDQPLKSWCTFGKARDLSTRCLPFSSVADYFSDAACQVPVVTFALSVNATPLFAYLPPASCTDGTPVFNVGASVPGNALSQRTGSTCSPSTVPRKAWAITEIDPATLVAPIAVDDSAGRIRGSYLVTPEEGKREFRGWTDTLRNNVSCSFTTMADGKVRCVPPTLRASVAGLNYYSDAACTKPIRYATTSKGKCSPPQYAAELGGTCSPNDAPTHYYTLKPGLYSGDIYDKYSGGGTCKKNSVTTVNDVYEVDAEVPFTDFAEGSFAIDP